MKRQRRFLEWFAYLFTPLFLSIDPYLFGKVGKEHPRLLNEEWLVEELKTKSVHPTKEMISDFEEATDCLLSIKPQEFCKGLKALEDMRNSQAEGACLLNNIGYAFYVASQNRLLCRELGKESSQLLHDAQLVLEDAKAYSSLLEPVIGTNFYSQLSRAIRNNLTDIEAALSSQNDG